MPKSVIKLIAFLVIGFVLTIFVASSALSIRRNKRTQMRATALPLTVEKAQPIIQAIERYQKEKGMPPQSLSALAPKYIGKIPTAGPAAQKGWHYEVKSDDDAGGWTLYIWVRDEYSPNIVGFGDRFVYHPSGKYPRTAYGGGLIPFGEWGYYVE